jgi:anti-sigma factor (TIGR02949 family)
MTPPERVDCQQAASRLYEYLDGEVTPEVEATVRAHLAECAGCFSLFGFEDAYLTFLRARTQARGAPEHLKKRIFERIMLDKEHKETK